MPTAPRSVQLLLLWIGFIYLAAALVLNELVLVRLLGVASEADGWSRLLLLLLDCVLVVQGVGTILAF